MKSNSSERGADSPHHREIAAALDRSRARLGRLATRVVLLESTPSTNDEAASLAAADEAEGVVVIADAQTSGRGRRGHQWFSPPGTGLYVSLIVAPARARVDRERATSLLTLMAGVALAEGIETASGLRVDLKWPNDLFVGRRKLGGILAEGAARESVVLGYGVNVATHAFPSELSDRATSLESELGRPIDRTTTLVETLAALARRYDELIDGQYDGILDAWRAQAPASRGARVAWSHGTTPMAGITAGIDDRGALLVQVGDGIERIVSGEITWL